MSQQIVLSLICYDTGIAFDDILSTWDDEIVLSML